MHRIHNQFSETDIFQPGVEDTKQSALKRAIVPSKNSCDNEIAFYIKSKKTKDKFKTTIKGQMYKPFSLWTPCDITSVCHRFSPQN